MITITQNCDGCGDTRELKGTNQEENGGWRKVTSLKHLCTKCLKKALGSDDLR